MIQNTQYVESNRQSMRNIALYMVQLFPRTIEDYNLRDVYPLLLFRKISLQGNRNEVDPKRELHRLRFLRRILKLHYCLLLEIEDFDQCLPCLEEHMPGSCA